MCLLYSIHIGADMVPESDLHFTPHDPLIFNLTIIRSHEIGSMDHIEDHKKPPKKSDSGMFQIDSNVQYKWQFASLFA